MIVFKVSGFNIEFVDFFRSKEMVVDTNKRVHTTLILDHISLYAFLRTVAIGICWVSSLPSKSLRFV
jgi:hypothetical protein